MENQVNLEEITDIKELESLGWKQYQILESAQRQVQQSNQNIQMINARMGQLQTPAPKGDAPLVPQAEVAAEDKLNATTE